MRLHFSIDGYDYRRTTRFRQSINFSITPVLFLLIMCIDAPESTTISRSSGLKLMQAGTYFPKVRRMLLFHALFIFTHFWPASTLLRGHLALPTLFPPETAPQILERWATLLRFAWANVSGRRILVSNFSVTRNSLGELHTLDWFLHVCALPENGLRQRHVLKYATQLPCIRRLTLRKLSSQLFITLLIRFP